MGPAPHGLPLSANRVAREGSGHLAVPPCRLPMVHQPVRVRIVLHEALRVAKGGENRETQREKRRGRELHQAPLKQQAVSPKLDSSCVLILIITIVFSSEATACVPESLRYFHSLNSPLGVVSRIGLP